MAKSYKLILAAATVAGGYGLAHLLGGLGSIVWRDAARQSDLAAAGATGFTLGSESSGNQFQVGGATLVPEPSTVAGERTGSFRTNEVVLTGVPHASSGQSPSLHRAMEPPTWLATAPRADLANSPTNPRPETAYDAAAGVASPPYPRARLKDVASRRAESVASVVSPWDRWPQWDPSSSAAAVDASRGAVAAVFQRPEKSAPGASHTSFEYSSDSTTGLVPVTTASAPPTDDVAELRTHFVIDGDSLSKLAGRYLDDPQLGEEIFRINRDVLSDSELLPIGVELRIPDRRMANWHKNSAKLRDVDTMNSSVPSGMLPVNDVPRVRDGAPRAQLMGPMAPTDWPARGLSGSWPTDQ